MLAQLTPRTGLAERVQRELARGLDAGSTGVDAIARQLAMSRGAPITDPILQPAAELA